MGSEQIFIDDKHVGEIIQLDEKWTIKIEYGYYDESKYGVYDCWGDQIPFTNNVGQEKEVIESFGKIERLECNCRKVTLYEKGNPISYIMEAYY